MKKIMTVVLTLLCTLLCACGGSKVDESLIGNYIPVTGEMMGIALVGEDMEGFAIELAKGGKGTMNVEGETGNIKWTNDDSTVTVTVDGVDMIAARGQDCLVFDDMLGMGMKMTFAKEGTDAANPELYLPETDKYMLGSWQSVDVTDILGNPLEPSEMEPDAFAMTARGDHTADITVEGKTITDLKWSNMGEHGSIDSEDINVSWEIVDDGISVDYVKDGEYYTFFCPKDSDTEGSGAAKSGDDTDEVDEAADADESEEAAAEDESEGSLGIGDKTEDASGTKGSKSTSQKLGDMLGDASEDAGKWVLFNVNQNGHVYMEDELAQKGIESWIEMDADGTGRINLVGDLMDMEWGDGHITVPDNGQGGTDEYKYTISNEYLVIVDEGMVLTFIKK